MTTPNNLQKLHSQNSGKITRGTLYYIDIDQIEEEPGFNLGRDYDDPDVIEHIETLAQSYADGAELPPLLVQVLDGRTLVRDGHCRLRAAILANSQGAEISRLPVMDSKGDAVDQTLVLLTSNSGLKQRPTGQAKIFAKLVRMGLTEDEIAARVKRTRSHVRLYLELDDIPLELKQLINDNQISWTMALQLYREKGSTAVKIIQKKRDKLLSDKNPNVRVTKKLISEDSGYRARFNGNQIREVTDCMTGLVDSFTEVEEFEDYVKISITKEDIEKLKSVYASILPKK